MTRAGWVLLWLLVVAGCLRGYRLGQPESVYFDEIYYVAGAQDYLAGRADENDVHPPLGKLQMAVGMQLASRLGLSAPAGWRLASWAAGMGSLLLTYRLALVLTNSSTVGLLAVYLLSFDFLQLVQSRVAMLDQLQSFWILAGLTAVAVVCRGRPSLMLELVAGLCFGAATACKWNGLFAVVGAVLARKALGGSWQATGRLALVLGLTVTLVYLSSYAPLLGREGSGGWQEICSSHLRMWRFRFDPQQFKHTYLSRFYSWPLVYRPVWYLFHQHGSLVEGIVAMGSPLFWWFSLLLWGDLLVHPQRRLDPAPRFLLINSLALWLLWALGTTGGFIYYMLPVTPLMAIMVARELADWWQESLSRGLAIAYLLAILLAFVAYFPLLTGMTVSNGYFRVLFCLPWWI